MSVVVVVMASVVVTVMVSVPVVVVCQCGAGVLSRWVTAYPSTNPLTHSLTSPHLTSPHLPLTPLTSSELQLGLAVNALFVSKSK